MLTKKQKKYDYWQINKQAEQEKWAKINDRFCTTDNGRKLRADGCAKRFEHDTVNDMFVDNKRELGNNRADSMERARMKQIEPDMSLDDMMDVLNGATTEDTSLRWR